MAVHEGTAGERGQCSAGESGLLSLSVQGGWGDSPLWLWSSSSSWCRERGERGRWRQWEVGEIVRKKGNEWDLNVHCSYLIPVLSYNHITMWKTFAWDCAEIRSQTHPFSWVIHVFENIENDVIWLRPLYRPNCPSACCVCQGHRVCFLVV